MLALEGDEEKIEPEETIAKWLKLIPRKRKNGGTGLKVLTPNKLLTRVPILLAKIKAGNSSKKLKNEIWHILYLFYQHNKITKKILKQFNQVMTTMEENMIVIRDPKTFYFHSDWPKDDDEKLSIKLNL